MPREHTSHSKHRLPTTQDMAVHMDITRWPITISILIILFQPKMEKPKIQSAKIRPGADCGSDHDLLVAKFRLKLKKEGKPLQHSDMI